MKIKTISILALIFIIFKITVIAQDLPKGMTEEEKLMWPTFYSESLLNKRIVSPPPGPVRAPGEWEEIQAITITWTSYQAVLAQIVKHAQLECKVIINCTDSNVVKNYLSSANVPITSNIKFLHVPFNSVWIRDYGAQSVYKNEVDSLYLVDWKYNRPQRTNDDIMPLAHAAFLGLPIYEMSANPYLLFNTGGNLMHDGFGTSMSSKLILNENPSLSETQINNLASSFWGTSRYIKFDVLPYDGINHIDMHMKLLDEETILLGEYPIGISDGPQIEANLQYLLANYNSVFGTPYRIVRIPMLPNSAGTSWPSTGAYYRTYTNAIFVNKTLIYPTYYQKYDTTAARILSEALPGYNLVGINCDPNPISASGAIHCITNSFGVENPLLIRHQSLRTINQNTDPIELSAIIKHKNGINSANVYYRVKGTQVFNQLNMVHNLTQTDLWEASIPAQSSGTKIEYYIKATANGGKIQNRPITAPDGYWTFEVSPSADIKEYISQSAKLHNPYPNPARAITCIPVESETRGEIKLELLDINGRIVKTLFEGETSEGMKNYFFDASEMSSGVYIIRLQTNNGSASKRIIVYGY